MLGNSNKNTDENLNFIQWFLALMLKRVMIPLFCYSPKNGISYQFRLRRNDQRVQISDHYSDAIGNDIKP